MKTLMERALDDEPPNYIDALKLSLYKALTDAVKDPPPFIAPDPDPGLPPPGSARHRQRIGVARQAIRNDDLSRLARSSEDSARIEGSVSTATARRSGPFVYQLTE